MRDTFLTPRNQIIAVAGIAAITLLYHLLFVWPSETQVREKQAAFLTAIEEGDNSVWESLLSDQYKDQWSFDKFDLMLSLQDLRSQLMALKLTWTPSTEFIESPDATLTGTIDVVEATGLYIPGDFVTGRINKLETPFIFTWKKESWKPWSWRLLRIENSDLSLDGYTPGEINRRFGR